MTSGKKPKSWCLDQGNPRETFVKSHSFRAENTCLFSWVVGVSRDVLRKDMTKKRSNCPSYVLPDFWKVISFWLLISMLWVAEKPAKDAMKRYESRRKTATQHPSNNWCQTPGFLSSCTTQLSFFFGGASCSIALNKITNSRHFWEFLEVFDFFLKDIFWPNPNQEEVEDWRVTDFQGDLTRKAGWHQHGGSE